MFGRSFLKEFEDDPFFSGFNSHKDIFESMGAFRDPFMAIEDGRRDKRGGGKDRENTDRPVADHFGGFFRSMNSMMSEMHKHMSDMQLRMDSDDPNIHSFSSSSVMSYRNDGKSEPKVFQASRSTRRAPGQIKETRRALRDSESGVEKMSVGHHIGEKGKVIERRRNMKAGGGMEEEKNFLHIGENEEHDFDREWRDKTSKFDLGYSKARPEIGGGKQDYSVQGEQKRKPVKTAEVGFHAPTPPRPHGPSKSGRTRSKY